MFASLFLGSQSLSQAQTIITETTDAFWCDGFTVGVACPTQFICSDYASLSSPSVCTNYVGTTIPPYDENEAKAALKFTLPASSATLSSVKLRLRVMDINGSPTATITMTDDNNWLETTSSTTSKFPTLINSVTLVSNQPVSSTGWNEFTIPVDNIASKINSTTSSDITLLITGSAIASTYFNFVADNNTVDMAKLVLSFQPTVTTQDVTNITSTTATGNGNITDLGSANPTAFGVCWNTTGTPTTADSKVDNGDASATGAFTASMTGLSPNIKYYVRAFATNTSGTSYGSEVSFTTTGIVPDITVSAENITSRGAKFKASVNPYNAPPTNITFEYDIDTNFDFDIEATGSPISDNSLTDVYATVTGLTPNQHYYLWGVALNSIGYGFSEYYEFDTPAEKATVTTTAATALAAEQATLNGTVNANNDATTVTFEYGTTDALGTTINITGDVTGTSDTPIEYTLTGLEPSTTYYYRIVGTNTAGAANGDIVSFSTTPMGTGTNVDPYQIATLNDLKWLSETKSAWVAGKYFKQTADIDASTTSAWDADKGFSPIGNGTDNFYGIYDGNNHLITGLTINRSTSDHMGLFACLNNASISNLGVKNCSVIGKDNVGAIASATFGTTQINNCFATGTISGTNYIGGLTGLNQGTSLNNDYFIGSVSATGTIAGGLVGWNKAAINYSYASATITGTTSGALVGNEQGTSTNLFYDSDVATGGSGTGKTTAEMKTQTTFTDSGWDFIGESTNGTNEIWALSSDVNSGYPCFSWQETLATPTVTTSDASDITINSATANGSITGLGFPNPTQHGVVWSTSTNPTVALTTKTEEGIVTATGDFTSSITGLTSGTTYYVRAYATNSQGTAYGDEISFTTKVTVTFDENGGETASDPESLTTAVGSTVTLPATAPTLTGYTFNGWNELSTGDGADFTSSTVVNGDITVYAKWTVNTYNITYDLDGGTNNVSNTATYTYGVGLTLGDPTKTGYTFNGWFDNDTFAGSAITEISGTETGDVDLFAKWTVNSYDITYNLDGGTNDVGNTDSYTYGVGLTLNDPTKENYSFEGWFDNDAFEGTAITEISTTDTGNKDLYAKWQADTYTITYNLDGGTNDEGNTDSYTYGVGLTLNNPTKEGFSFEGWFDNGEFSGDEITAISDTDTGNKTLFAKWVVSVYDITYYLNGGENNPANVDTYTTGEGLVLAAPSKLGYSFKGWYTSPTFSGTAKTAIGTSETGDITLYAKWAAATYPITYHLNGGVNNENNLSSFTYGVGLVLNAPTKEGNTFGGWYEDPEFLGDLVTEISDSRKVDINLYAKWAPNTYAITYYLDGGENNINNAANYTYGVGLVLSNPTRVGFVFSGWYSNSSFSGSKITEISTTSASNVSLYAKWSSSSYKITYNLDGGINNAANTATYVYGLGLVLGDPTKAGYTFNGWFDNSAFSGLKITEISATASGDKILFAKWTLIPVNTAPEITSVAPVNATETLLYTYTVTATDKESNPLTYTLSGQPSGMTITSSGVITWTPAKGVTTSGEVTLTVSDGSLTDTEKFTITVSPITGIIDAVNILATAYPNPFTDKLNISILNGNTASYKLVSASGNLIKNGILEGALTSLNLEELVPGVYLLQLSVDDETQVIKIVKK